VCRGLLNEIGNNLGLWGAVLAHEVSHSGLRHGVRDYLFRLRMRSAMARYGAGRFAPGYGANHQRGLRAGYGRTPSDAAKRMRQSLEIRADQVGMLVMARAGYHPDYVFALHQLLEYQPGERSRPAVSLSDRPTWEPEEQQIEGQYANAMAAFHKYWPNAAQSPGF
jgi:predicted Zn-dependent protease